MAKRIPPPGLVLMQEQFGKSIRTPFSFSTGQFECQKERYSQGVSESINPRQDQTGRDRLAVYNEQYWYRLLTVLQDDFPLLAATLGLWEFNQLATAFLDQHPSQSPYLQNLTQGFLEFLQTSPTLASPRLMEIATLEMAFQKAFHAPSIAYLDPQVLSPQEQEILADTALAFQPWFSLVEENANLMECRRELMEEKIAAPLFVDQKGYWAVFRNENFVEWIKLEPLQFSLLKLIYNGEPLSSACEAIAQNLNETELESLMVQIPAWFESWTRLKWFAKPVL